MKKFKKINLLIFEKFVLDTSDNFLTPSSTKDFTSGIAERCRKLQQPQPQAPRLILQQPTAGTTTILNIDSGKVNTILSFGNQTRFNSNIDHAYLTNKKIELASPTDHKKPSYLNLACCVNGYSNYTTYKSREVSPIRPIINSISMSRQQRSNDSFLIVNGNNRVYNSVNSTTTRFASLSVEENDDVDNARNIGNKQR